MEEKEKETTSLFGLMPSSSDPASLSGPADPSSNGPSSETTDSSGFITNNQRRSKRDRKTVDYAKIEEGVVIPMTSEFYFMDDMTSNSTHWISLFKNNNFMPYHCRKLTGNQLTLTWAKNDGLIEPFMVEQITPAFGLVVPSTSINSGNDFNVKQVCEILGLKTIINVIDVSTQNEVEKGKWTLEKWCDYYYASSSKKKQIYSGQGPLNVISLEFSDTNLMTYVKSPNIVRLVDWIDNIWPQHLKKQSIFPKSQYYCLMSVSGCYTDFHIGGTSL